MVPAASASPPISPATATVAASKVRFIPASPLRHARKHDCGPSRMASQYAHKLSEETSVALHFERSEFADRIARARRAVKEEGLAALLVFAQESHYWLT